ncbi:MAG: hypothetical protein H7201_04335 [Candidatus Saccharibacteria bacterium]|nr:hypothetical protein [Microbacteriaceae bacterium]
MSDPKLYIHVKMATHFLRWELPEFAKHFEIVDSPASDTILLSFGPDALDEASRLPARARFAVLFPGFSFNPVRDLGVREAQLLTIRENFRQVFINPGPLEIAYADLENVSFYPFSIDVNTVTLKGFRTAIDTLLHVSHDNPQKDWRRSEAVMHKTGLDYEVFPPRDSGALEKHSRRGQRLDLLHEKFGSPRPKRLPVGYFDHKRTIAKYQEYDGFVHVAREVRHPEFIDGKYTASLIEAGVTGGILFWHDTWDLGNGLETVFDLPLDSSVAAREILEIRSSIDVRAHSQRTREEMLDVFNPQGSVRVRVERMMELL